MSTKPLDTILYRELSVVAAKEIVEIASPLLQELVNYSTNAFARCASSASGEENEDLAVLSLYLHIIEMSDGIEVLLSQSCPIPAMPLVRSSFEALVSIEYILEADYVRRSLSWLADYVHKRLAFYESLIPSTARGRAFRKARSEDKTTRDFEWWRFPDPTEVQGAIANLQRLLARSQFQPIEAEFARCKRRRKRRPYWYQLFGGPPNLRELAKSVNRHAQYDMLYRHWSTIAHAHDFSRFLTRTDKDEPAIKGLRDHSSLKGTAVFAAHFILDATRVVLGKFRPGEETAFAKWYVTEVRERFCLLTGEPDV